MDVTQIFRKRDPRFFSIERVFEQIAVYGQHLFRTTVTVLPRSGFSFANLLFLKNQVNSNQKNIYHVTGDAHYVVFALPRKRTVLTIHDCVFLRSERSLKGWLVKQIYLIWPVRYCKYITTISEASKLEILKHSGCEPSKVIVIPNPVSTSLTYSDNPFNRERPRILFIGSTPNKNLSRVIKAIDEIPCLLRVVGEVPAEEIALLQKQKIQYTIASGLSDKQINDEYASCDLVLFPSTYEGFGLPIVEANICGRIVVTSNIAPMSEIADDAAILVDPYCVQSIREGILTAIENEDLRKQKILRGFNNYKKYLPDTIACKYGELYRSVSAIAAL